MHLLPMRGGTMSTSSPPGQGRGAEVRRGLDYPLLIELQVGENGGEDVCKENRLLEDIGSIISYMSL